jgi:Ca2+-binding RTX toxin-like protein
MGNYSNSTRSEPVPTPRSPHADIFDDYFYDNDDVKDFVDSGYGDDNLWTRGGDDIVYAGPGNDYVMAGDGVDMVSAGKGNDVLDGEAGNDWLWGEDGDDAIHGGDGIDYVDGGAGTDILSGDQGNDFLYGGDDDDSLWGNDGNDTLSGDLGADTLNGGVGADTLKGGDGADELYGGTGMDIIVGGAGIDFLVGGAANPSDGLADTFLYEHASQVASAPGGDIIYGIEMDPAAHDVIDISALLPQEITSVAQAKADGYLQVKQSGSDALVQIDFDGGSDDFVTLAMLQDTNASAVANYMFLV